MSAAELPELSLEVSVLGPLEPVDPPDAAAIAIGRHGLVVEQGHRRGLLLPQVATERGWTVEQFLAADLRQGRPARPTRGGTGPASGGSTPKCSASERCRSASVPRRRPAASLRSVDSARRLVPRLGAHLSIAGGLPRAVDRAVASRCEALQIFTKSAGQWRARALPAEEIALFRRRVEETGIHPVVAHNSYLINLAAAAPALRAQSIAALGEELDRAEALGLDGLVMHPGSYTTGTRRTDCA